MSWQTSKREVARLTKLIPPPPKEEDLAWDRFNKKLQASGDWDMLRIIQHIYRVLAANPSFDLTRVLNPDDSVANAILEATGPATGPIRRLTPADVERFLEFWEASQKTPALPTLASTDVIGP